MLLKLDIPSTLRRADWDRIDTMWQAGYSASAIADEFGHPYRVVCAVLKKLGYQPSPHKRPPTVVNTPRLRRIAQLRLQGWLLRDIAVDIGVSKERVRQLIAAHLNGFGRLFITQENEAPCASTTTC